MHLKIPMEHLLSVSSFYSCKRRLREGKGLAKVMQLVSSRARTKTWLP